MKSFIHFDACRPARKVCLWVMLAMAMLTLTATQTMAQSNGSTYSSANGIDDLPGIDPSASVADGTYNVNRKTAPEDGNKVLCFYNIGAKRFLSIGGYWGTHASLSTTPYALWLETSNNGATFYVGNQVAGSGTGTHIGFGGNNVDVYMDRAGSPVTFVQADGYSEENKVYYIKLNGQYYLTVYPENEDRYCNQQTTLETGDKQANQKWKIITRNEYYELAKANPANMAAVIDFSFLLKSPGFRVNDTDMSNWLLGKSNTSANVRFGDKTMYCTYDKRGTLDNGHFTQYIEAHQRDYGKYFYCYAKGQENFNLYQDVKVHKPGWYVVRCNGFSTQQEVTNGNSIKPLAFLFATVIDASGNVVSEQATSSTLNLIDQATATALESQEDGAGIGKAFFEGEYENQVQICLETTPDGKEISNDNPLTLRIGFYVEKGTETASSDDITAVDNFKLLYAGPRRNPELILDEDQTSLNYLANATDTYTNSVLHLRRTLNDNKWNSLVLPVDLTCGQLKRTFGDAVKVAKLEALTKNSIQFVTVEGKTDDEVMMEAFTPYIIYPPVVNVTSPAYTAEKFYTSEGESNTEWLGKDGKTPSTSEDDALSITIPSDHYVITMVSLDRDKFNAHINPDNWESTVTVSGSGLAGTLTCKGTMAKTFSDTGIIEGRDPLSGDFFMYKGNLWQVPTNQQYGLKAFRCWFELADNTQTGKQMSLCIDGIEDSTTGIEDIHTDTSATSHKRGINGVYSLDGQQVSPNNSTEGLPKGIYICNGRKVVVK